MKTVSGIERSQKTIKRLRNDAEQNAQEGRGKKQPRPLALRCALKRRSNLSVDGSNFTKEKRLFCVPRLWQTFRALKDGCQ
jgi:hypothetical protein